MYLQSNKYDNYTLFMFIYISSQQIPLPSHTLNRLLTHLNVISQMCHTSEINDNYCLTNCVLTVCPPSV